VDAATVVAALQSLPTVGTVAVDMSYVTATKIEGVQAVFPRDADFGYLVKATALLFSPGRNALTASLLFLTPTDRQHRPCAHGGAG
jgi:hypothetical protein